MAEVQVLKIASGDYTRHSTTADSIRILSLGVGVASPTVGVTIASQVATTVKVVTFGANVTIDWNDSNVQDITLTGNVTFAFSNLRSGAHYQLVIRQDGTGSRTATWPATAKFTGTDATLTTTASAVDIYDGVCDGTNVYFNAVKKGF